MKPATLKQFGKVIQMFVDKDVPEEHLQWMFRSGALSDLLVADQRGFNRNEYRNVLGLKPLGLPSLLTRFAGSRIAATTTPFVAFKNFIVNDRQESLVKISCLRDEFVKRFLRKKEGAFSGAVVLGWDLSGSPSTDDLIIAELGGEEKAEITLTELFSLMRAQKNGDKGILLTNCNANIFYVRDIENVLCSVCLIWKDNGWYLDAYSIADQRPWGVDFRVFSRGS